MLKVLAVESDTQPHANRSEPDLSRRSNERSERFAEADPFADVEIPR